jgi:NDP-sugar pyrophosphorylase family protein
MTTRALILAGGRGTRMAPYTAVLPKPLLPVGQQSILEIIITQLVNQSICDITISIGYLGHLIEAVVGDGSALGAKISYVREVDPLGTAGPLGLLQPLSSDDDLVVLNGDTLTDLNIADVVAARRASGAVIEVVAQLRSHQIEFGVLDVDADGHLRTLHEKPTSMHLVAIGVYVVSSIAVAQVVAGTRLDFPELIAKNINQPGGVHVHVFDGTWLDLGRLDDFTQAVDTFESNRAAFLKVDSAVN